MWYLNKLENIYFMNSKKEENDKGNEKKQHSFLSQSDQSFPLYQTKVNFLLATILFTIAANKR